MGVIKTLSNNIHHHGVHLREEWAGEGRQWKGRREGGEGGANTANCCSRSLSLQVSQSQSVVKMTYAFMTPVNYQL